MNNYMEISFDSNSINEGLARIAVSGFTVQLNPTIEELADIKTAVSEAVTNSIVHGYDDKVGKVTIKCTYNDEKVLAITVSDDGKGIQNIQKAMQPFYTSKPNMDRSGMGFTVMETFMDEIKVESSVGVGTKVTMKKKIESVKNECQ